MVRDSTIVVFELHGQRFGLPLRVVERVLPALAITPLPNAPAVVQGIIDVRGELFPVINLRRRFQLPERELELSDQLVLTRTNARKLSLLVDSVSHVEFLQEGSWVDAESSVAGTRYLAGAIKSARGITLIHDLDTCLSLTEEATLDEALSAAAADEART